VPFPSTAVKFPDVSRQHAASQEGSPICLAVTRASTLSDIRPNSLWQKYYFEIKQSKAVYIFPPHLAMLLHYRYVAKHWIGIILLKCCNYVATLIFSLVDLGLIHVGHHSLNKYFRQRVSIFIIRRPLCYFVKLIDMDLYVCNYMYVNFSFLYNVAFTAI